MKFVSSGAVQEEQFSHSQLLMRSLKSGIHFWKRITTIL